MGSHEQIFLFYQFILRKIKNSPKIVQLNFMNSIGFPHILQRKHTFLAQFFFLFWLFFSQKKITITFYYTIKKNLLMILILRQF